LLGDQAPGGSLRLPARPCRRYVKTNAALRPKRLPPPKRIEIWSHALEDEFCELARDSLRLGFMLMLYTCQRRRQIVPYSGVKVYQSG
jgi:hypothetical protein